MMYRLNGRGLCFALCLSGVSGFMLGCSSDEGAGPSGPNLSGQDFSGDDLSGRDFSGALMTDVNLSNAVVNDADFSGAVLNGANLSGVDLSDAQLDNVIAQDLAACPELLPEGWLCADLGATGKTLLGPSTVLEGVDLSGATLSEREVKGMQAIRLVACPAELPPSWQCTQLPPLGLTLIGPDANLGGLDLRNAAFGSIHNLEDVSFAGSNLAGATFATDANLSEADFTGANLSGVSFGADTNLKEAKLGGANLSGVSLADANLEDVAAADLASCPEALPGDWRCIELGPSGHTLVGPGADLSGLDLSGSDLSNLNLKDADFEGSKLTGVDFRGADLENAKLDRAALDGVRASGLEGCPDSLPDGWGCVERTLAGPGANLSGVDLSQADLTDIDLARANLSGARLIETNLTGVDLTGVNLTGANLTRANLTDAELRDVIATDMTWSSTICPDGSNSDAHGGSCL